MVSHSTVARLNLAAIITVGALSASAVAPATAVADSPELQEIVVTATLRSMPATEVPASVTVLSEQTLRDAGRANLEDVLGLIPNLNWAGDTSLPRYFQLRGIGELEQYQGAPNPSVGFLIDDIDFSGLGTAGTLYDIDQVDVHARAAAHPLRGERARRTDLPAAAPSPPTLSTAASIWTRETTRRILKAP